MYPRPGALTLVVLVPAKTDYQGQAIFLYTAGPGKTPEPPRSVQYSPGGLTLVVGFLGKSAWQGQATRARIHAPPAKSFKENSGLGVDVSSPGWIDPGSRISR